MYDVIMDTTYSKAREKYEQFVDTDSAKRIIAIKNSASISSLSDTSDIIIYYSVIEDSTPLLAVERMDKSEVKMWRVRRVVKKVNRENQHYKAAWSISDDKKYVDIIVVKRSIYESLYK